MKLAFCLFKYFPFGGLQRDFLRIAKEVVCRGHQVDVFTMLWEGELEPALSIHIIPVKKLQNHQRAQAFFAKVQPRLIDYDLVVGFNKMPGLDVYYAADTCYQAKAKQQHGVWYQLTPRYRHLIDYEKSVFSVEETTKILLLSRKQQNEFVHFYKTPDRRFELLPPGIAKDRIAPPNARDIRCHVRQTFKIQEQEFLLVLVGSGFKTKGLDRVLVGYAALPDELKNKSYLYIVGQDNSRLFEKQAKKLNILPRIQFLGGRNDVADLLLAADVLVHPAYNENTGTVLLEALASGLPVLTTDICGYAHFIKDAEAGIVLSSPFQQSEFNQSLVEMLSHQKRIDWQEKALAFSKQADIYSLPERAVDIIENSHRQRKYSFEEMMALKGEVYRTLEGRCTQRVVLDNQVYFIKQHSGIGWKEIFKNIFQLRIPVISAKNEWLALQRLQELNIACPKIISYGCQGINPATRKSYIMMEALNNHISLEELSKNWQHCPPSFITKKNLIEAVARIARTLHENGINHRDFYICHFLLDLSLLELEAIPANPKLYLIDLHRASVRKKIPIRWIIKDLAGLYFSVKNIGLTQRDFLRFMRAYRSKNSFQKEGGFWKKVIQRGEKLYKKIEG
ncbi:MAG: rfaG [Gammaproteobacteria bacterium]|nr:rfaG [Gammaproteobacteria bacterium]